MVSVRGIMGTFWRRWRGLTLIPLLAVVYGLGCLHQPKLPTAQAGTPQPVLMDASPTEIMAINFAFQQHHENVQVLTNDAHARLTRERGVSPVANVRWFAGKNPVGDDCAGWLVNDPTVMGPVAAVVSENTVASIASDKAIGRAGTHR